MKKHYAYYDVPKGVGNHGSFDTGVMPNPGKRRKDKCTSHPIRMGTVERTAKTRKFIAAKHDVSVYWDTKEDADGNIVKFVRKLNFKRIHNNVANWTPEVTK